MQPNTQELIMEDDELFERIRKYKMRQGEHWEDVFGISAIFMQAGINVSEGYRILNGKVKLGLLRRQRLTRAVVIAETGMMRKVNGKIVIGEPTRAMPPRLRINISNLGVKLETPRQKLGIADVMPSFKQIFGR